MPDLKTSIAQIFVILISSYAVGWLLGKVRQPQVIGEMVAGILLGPSLLGWAAPRLSAALFPPESLGFLYFLSQVGLLLFMFMVGLELDTNKLRQLGRAAVITSQTSIIAPFVLGVLLAVYLYPRLTDSSTSYIGFLLFMGTAMSVTAFPVLARILSEQNLLGTRVGTITIASAAVDDVTAWCLLAVIIAVVRAKLNQPTLWQSLVGLLIYLAMMLAVVRPILAKLGKRFGSKVTQRSIVAVLLFMLASSLATELLGIHTLFGAFLAGIVMPKEQGLVEQVREKFGSIPVLLLLPLFFAFTGLRTNIGLIIESKMLLYFGLVLLVAVAGKLGGSMLAARFIGMRWSEAAAVGILMNTRGLIELVILNIGLDLGVLSRSLFSMMVVMAIVTTLMTAPALSWLYSRGRFLPPLSRHKRSLLACMLLQSPI